MSAAASSAHRFYEEVASTGVVYTIEDDEGYPAPKNGDGKRVMPFWSSSSRVDVILKTVPAYSGFRLLEMPWSFFRDTLAPDLAKHGMLVGLNWSGPRAIGYDMPPERVVQTVESRRNAPPT